MCQELRHIMLHVRIPPFPHLSTPKGVAPHVDNSFRLHKSLQMRKHAPLKSRCGPPSHAARRNQLRTTAEVASVPKPQPKDLVKAASFWARGLLWILSCLRNAPRRHPHRRLSKLLEACPRRVRRPSAKSDLQQHGKRGRLVLLAERSRGMVPCHHQRLLDHRDELGEDLHGLADRDRLDRLVRNMPPGLLIPPEAHQLLLVLAEPPKRDGRGARGWRLHHLLRALPHLKQQVLQKGNPHGSGEFLRGLALHSMPLLSHLVGADRHTVRRVGLEEDHEAGVQAMETMLGFVS